jgi:sporulation protein YlmC with PRC-barrel domain
MANDERLRELEERYEGYTVYDNAGSRIGKVDDLFVDDTDREEYIGVKMGLFGLSGTTLIPMEISRVNDRDRTIEVSESKEHVKDAPNFTVALTADIPGPRAGKERAEYEPAIIRSGTTGRRPRGIRNVRWAVRKTRRSTTKWSAGPWTRSRTAIARTWAPSPRPAPAMRRRRVVCATSRPASPDAPPAAPETKTRAA